MTHKKTLTIPAAEFDRFSAILDSGVGVPGAKSTEVLYQGTAHFDNGFQMDIKVVNGVEEPWTEGVLFDATGHELGCTEVDDSLEGEYIIPHHPDLFVCVVQRENT